MLVQIESIVSAESSNKSSTRTAEPRTRATPTIEHHHLVHSLGNTRPSVAAADFARLKRM